MWLDTLSWKCHFDAKLEILVCVKGTYLWDQDSLMHLQVAKTASVVLGQANQADVMQ